AAEHGGRLPAPFGHSAGILREAQPVAYPPVQVDAGEPSETCHRSLVQEVGHTISRPRLHCEAQLLAVDQFVAQPARSDVAGRETLQRIAFELREAVSEQAIRDLDARLV